MNRSQTAEASTLAEGALTLTEGKVHDAIFILLTACAMVCHGARHARTTDEDIVRTITECAFRLKTIMPVIHALDLGDQPIH